MFCIRKNRIITGFVVLIATFFDVTAQSYNSTMSPVLMPVFPSKMVLVGDTIDLDRCDMFERFDREFTSFCYTHSTTGLMIKRANRYYPVLDSLLKSHGVHTDFKYLATIESSLNTRAVSPAGAVGLWQLMPATAKEMGLEVNDYVDERYDIDKSTAVACRYFRTAYAKYGDWGTVAAAYNAGMARISSFLEKQQADHFFDLWVAEETSRYVFRIAAIKMLMQDPQKYGFVFTRRQLYMPIKTTNIVVNTPIENWAVFAANHGLTYAQLREFNPWIRNTSLPNKSGKSYVVKVVNKEDLYRKNQQEMVYNPKWTID